MKFKLFEAPPPGAWLVTVTVGVPAEAMAAAGIAAVSWVELTNVVAVASPPKMMLEPATKFVPLTVSVKAADPGMALFGEIVVTVGTGFGWLVTGWAVPHPVRHKRLAIPRSANPFIRILRMPILFMMPLESRRQLKWITVNVTRTVMQVRSPFNRQQVKCFGRCKQQIARELTPEVAGGRSGDSALVIDFPALA
jgi:hypothetical protein